MFVAKSLNAEHKDLIHDVAFDFYGRRMATCSSDQSVKVGESKCHENIYISWSATVNPLLALCTLDKFVVSSNIPIFCLSFPLNQQYLKIIEILYLNAYI